MEAYSSQILAFLKRLWITVNFDSSFKETVKSVEHLEIITYKNFY